MSWLSSSSDHTTKTIWRIDSTGVSAMVISSANNNVIYYEFQPITFFTIDERHRYDQLMHHTELLITRMAQSLIIFLKKPADNVVVVLGEPWTHSIRRHIVYKRKTPFTLTRAFIDDLVDRDMKRVNQEYKRNHGNAVELLPPTYHELQIAGHPNYDAFGKVVNDVRLTYTTGFSDPGMTALLKVLIHEKTKVRMINIQFDQYQNYVMRFWKHITFPSGVIIDTSGFVTDVYIFQNNGLVQAGTLPTGLSEVRQKLAYDLGIYPTELESLLALYQKKILDEVTTIKIDGELEKAYHIWERHFQKFCHTAVSHGDILDQVIWLGNETNPILSYFMNALHADPLSFPVIFGSTQVGFIHSDSILDVLHNHNHVAKLQNQDRIIVAALND